MTIKKEKKLIIHLHYDKLTKYCIIFPFKEFKKCNVYIYKKI